MANRNSFFGALGYNLKFNESIEKFALSYIFIYYKNSKKERVYSSDEALNETSLIFVNKNILNFVDI
ncbi:unnamed protein product [Meloidogyne enterolobii]|uniref:Uncharacterized protein n=1 Tax=Meloidogyne enterolobii TaxID=390850 RepID=A0ACB0XPM1_MELEN